MMGEAEKEAQTKGYQDGKIGKAKCPGEFKKYSNLLAAYERGWRLGHQDHERDMDQLCKEP